MSLANFWRRHCVVIIFPTLSIGSIAADYSYTRRWKQTSAQQQQQQQQSRQD